MRFQDLTGQKFGRLTVISRVANRGIHAAWLCRCECGGTSEAISGNLKAGTTASCGCLHRESVNNLDTRYRKHGLSESAEYGIYCGIRSRCTSTTNVQFVDYGGRGIELHERWSGEDGFAHFLEDMGPRPSAAHSIDRIDNDGDYCPANCRWATRKAQSNNTRANVWIALPDGRKVTVAQLAEMTGVPYHVAHRAKERNAVAVLISRHPPAPR